MIARSAQILVLILASMSVFGCSPQQPPQRANPLSLLQMIPAADQNKYDAIHDMKSWRNPYLIVRTDGVALYDSADSAEILLKPDELLPALAKLPGSNWPYGRVVAATETNSRASDQDGIAIRRNKGIIGGMLQGAHIVIKWVPSS